jgi:capsular polysaccharide biosynthesis protein
VYGQNVYSENLRINNVYTESQNTVSVVFNNKAPQAMKVDSAEVLETEENVISYLLPESEMRVALNTLHAAYT